jgi:hypothetical protein
MAIISLCSLVKAFAAPLMARSATPAIDNFFITPTNAPLAESEKRKRIVMAGKFISKRGQQENKCLPLLKEGLIRYFLSEGNDLANKQGTRLKGTDRSDSAFDVLEPAEFLVSGASARTAPASPERAEFERGPVAYAKQQANAHTKREYSA